MQICCVIKPKLDMNTTVINKPYAYFMKEVLSFCETACGEYQIPILLISTRNIASSLFAEYVKRFILSEDPRESLFRDLKEDVDLRRVESRLRKLQKSSLYISDQDHLYEDDLAGLDTRGAMIVIIDDLAAVPPLDVLDKWAEEKGVKVIVREDMEDE